jgi:hypothetical protein
LGVQQHADLLYTRSEFVPAVYSYAEEESADEFEGRYYVLGLFEYASGVDTSGRFVEMMIGEGCESGIVLMLENR